MKAFLKQLKWQFLIFLRNNLVAMAAAMTAAYVLIIYLLRDVEGVEKFITLLIYNDPAIIGFIFIGVSIILEKDQEVLPALFVTPLSLHAYLISKITVLSLIGTAGSLAMVIGAKGVSINFPHFLVGAFSTCVLFSIFGIFVVSFTTEILHFLLRGIPVLVTMSLPLLNYFELTDLGILKFFPAQGGLNLMINSYGEAAIPFELLLGYISIIFWVPLLYWFVHRTFAARIAKS